MRPTTLVLAALAVLLALPSTASACMWNYEPSPPLDFLIAANSLAALCAMFWVVRGKQTPTRMPEAIIVASVVAGLGLGNLGVGDNWSDLSGLVALAFLPLPYVAMRLELKSRWKRGVALGTLMPYFLVSTIFVAGAFQGRKTGGFQPADPEVMRQVTF